MQIYTFILFAAVFLWLIAVWPGRGRRERMAAFERQLIAHRGLHSNQNGTPENSLKAFRLAAAAGYGIELDVRETADEALVVCHDDSLKRVAGLKRKISEMTLREIRGVRLFGTGEGIPTFEEALEVIGGRVPLIVEIKAENVRSFARVSEHTAMCLDSYEGVTCMESFHPGVLRWFRKNRPETLRGQLSERFKREPFPKNIMMFLFSCCFFNFLTKPDFVAYRFSHAGLLRFRLLRDLFHVCCAGWTIRSSADLEMAAANFDVIIFDGFSPEGRAERAAAHRPEPVRTETDMIRKHLLVSGMVTGVGFRYRATSIAQLLGITGWVKNTRDGRVEMEIQGKMGALDELMKRLGEQRWIEITGVEEETIPVLRDEYEFKVRY